ncbi:MAG: phosphate ABC transporter ATP-binding protein PstB [Candidatus Omnitrophota bacterium]|nr:phosphate ABC transporter ATP-binding protein PstB [Candidatus Omnitrophota bacterium]MDZ4242791.1 phosphate ABC transporter ATP-binding protein PstB [Candidatus Omnitrophota bacterium]
MPIVETKNLNLYYGDFHALKDVTVDIRENYITALIGPSGCGKSTFLRTLNRMNDLIEGVRVEGDILIDGENILAPQTDLVNLRKKVGMVFQRPNPFPLSIAENILFAPKIHKTANKKDYERIVEECLKAVLLWDKLKDKLNSNALNLSLEQQQRLCVARLLPIKPEVLLMDEPCSALDPIATEKIEELMWVLKKNYTIIIVTHNMQQAARVSDDTGFMLLGELVEFGPTKDIFMMPRDPKTHDYITGRFG